MMTVSCLWTQDEDSNWHTGCGEIFIFDDGTPRDNKFNFCHCCGKKLTLLVDRIPHWRPLPNPPKETE